MFRFNLLILNLVFVTFVKSDCFQNDQTWDSLGQLEVLINIPTLHECIESCLQNHLCSGYTWYKSESTKFENICILFDSLYNEYPCENCISGEFANLQNCICNIGMGECKEEDGNLIGASNGVSSIDCLIQCSELENCRYFTYYGKDHPNIKEMCSFYSSCDEISPCEACSHASLDCENH